MKWICPSVVIYLASIVPAIWILELTTNRIELLCLYVQSFDTADALQRSLLMDLLQVFNSSLMIILAAVCLQFIFYSLTHLIWKKPNKLANL